MARARRRRRRICPRRSSTSASRSPARRCADIPENEPRWKRGVALLDESMGEALGKLYVRKYFPPENKARMHALVNNLLDAYARRHRRLGLDERGDQEGRTRKARQVRQQDRLSR